MAIQNLIQKIRGVYKNSNNLYPLLKELGENSGVPDPLIVEELEADNIFANDEIEFADSSGDFGTNAKTKIAAIGITYEVVE